MLAYADARTTERVYRRRPERVRFPEGKLGTPGPKDRPALVIEVEVDPEDDSASIVRVAYGTLQDVA